MERSKTATAKMMAAEKRMFGSAITKKASRCGSHRFGPSRKGSTEFAHEIAALGDRRGEDDLCGVTREVADRGAVHEGRHHQHRDEGHRPVKLVHHERRVLEDVPDAAADAHVVRDDREEGQQADDQQEDVHHRLPKPIAHLEEKEAKDHADTDA